MSTSSVTINFGTGSDSTDSAGISFSLESEDNLGKSNFVLNDTAVLRFYNPDNKAVSFFQNKGTFSLKSQGHTEEKFGFLLFANTDTSDLPDIPKQILSYYWVGTPPIGVSFSGKTARIPEKGVHVLAITYTTEFSLYNLTSGGIEGPSLVFALADDGDSTSHSVDFQDPETSAMLVDVTLNVKDFCDDLSVAGAAILITGNGANISGVADEVGSFHVGPLYSGTYEITITATNYLDSGVDALHNDYFTIPFIPLED